MMVGGSTPQRGVAAARSYWAGRDRSPGGNIDDRRDGHGGVVVQAARCQGVVPRSRSAWKQRRLSFRPTANPVGRTRLDWMAALAGQHCASAPRHVAYSCARSPQSSEERASPGVPAATSL
jgi:hypothetical protein